MRCESFYVHLVNDRMGRWPVNRRVAFPVIQAGIYYHALHRSGSVVSFLLRCYTGVAFRDNHAATIWVEQNFRSIKSQPAGRIVRSISPKAVKLTGLHARDKGMPVMVSAVDYRVQGDCARRAAVVLSVKEKQVDP